MFTSPLLKLLHLVFENKGGGKAPKSSRYKCLPSVYRSAQDIGFVVLSVFQFSWQRASILRKNVSSLTVLATMCMGERDKSVTLVYILKSPLAPSWASYKE